jgi:hypothetical protein
MDITNRKTRYRGRTPIAFFRLALGICLVCSSHFARADDMVVIPSAADLSWQMDPNGKVWMWNLHAFDSTFLACCYKYYIDTTTASGRTMWATVLSYMMKGDSRLVMHVSNKTQVGPITFIGN